MQDPHVDRLRYRLELPRGLQYQAPPLEFERPGFKGKLAESDLICVMLEHYSDIATARRHTEPFLEAWAADVLLREQRVGFAFTFQDGHLIDRAPRPPAAGITVALPVAEMLVLAERLDAVLTRGTYPEPPTHFQITPDVETLYRRYAGYLQEREPLLAMAYFCLTVLEARGGGRAPAATLLAVEIDVLRKLGELTSTRGEPAVARKAGSGEALTKPEELWIKTVVPRLIQRLAQIEAGQAPAQLAMADLPTF